MRSDQAKPLANIVKPPNYRARMILPCLRPAHALRFCAAAVLLFAASSTIARAQQESSGYQGYPTPGAAASADPAVSAAVEKQYAAFQAGKIDRREYTAKVNQALTPDVIARASRELKGYGALKSLSLRYHTVKDDNQVYFYQAVTERATLSLEYAVDASGKISSFYFRPVPASTW